MIHGTRMRRALVAVLLFTWSLQACTTMRPTAPAPGQQFDALVLRSGQRVATPRGHDGFVLDTALVLTRTSDGSVVASYSPADVAFVEQRRFSALRTAGVVLVTGAVVAGAYAVLSWWAVTQVFGG